MLLISRFRSRQQLFETDCRENSQQIDLRPGSFEISANQHFWSTLRWRGEESGYVRGKFIITNRSETDVLLVNYNA